MTDDEDLAHSYWKKVRSEVDPNWRAAERKFRDGDKTELLQVMNLCVSLRMPFPGWVRIAFLTATSSLPRSWDDVFGRPLPKGKNPNKERLWIRVQVPLYLRVQELHARGKPIDEDMFKVVGKELGISGGTANRIYYEGINHGYGMLVGADPERQRSKSGAAKRKKRNSQNSPKD